MKNHNKKCKICNREVPEDSIFCPYCGSNNIELFKPSIQIEITKVCRNCGNAVDNDSVFCSYCGSNDLEEIEKINNNTKKLSNQRNGEFLKVINNDHASNNSVTKYVLYILFVVVVICGIWSVTGEQYKENSAINLEPVVDYEYEPVHVENGQIFASPLDFSNSHHTIEIENKSSKDCFVMLDGLAGSGAFDQYTIYIMANSKVELMVASDKYTLSYATGDIWYGVLHKFGSNTQYYSSYEYVNLESFNQTYALHDHILYPVHSIDKNRFNKNN